MTNDLALQRAIADACLNEAAGEAIALDLRGFLEAHGVAREDVEAVLQAPRRLAVYRSLVRNGLCAVVARILPRTRARMNAACGGRFDADLARFLEERGPRTRYLRDVPEELVTWAAPRWTADPRVPSYLRDLAVYELTCFAVASCETVDPPACEIAASRPLVFVESTRLLRADWAVHELGSEMTSTEEPVRRSVRLLAYRDAQHAVRWLELTPMAAAIVERLAAGESLAVAVASACEAAGTSVDRTDVARLLTDLADRGIILGSPAI
jgi:uncharacterized protein